MKLEKKQTSLIELSIFLNYFYSASSSPFSAPNQSLTSEYEKRTDLTINFIRRL